MSSSEDYSLFAGLLWPPYEMLDNYASLVPTAIFISPKISTTLLLERYTEKAWDNILQSYKLGFYLNWWVT